MIKGGVPDKPRKVIKVYKQYEETPGFEYKLFNVCILYLVCIFLMVFNADKPYLYGLPCGLFLIGAIGCIAIFMVIIVTFYTLYIRKELIGEYTEDERRSDKV